MCNSKAFCPPSLETAMVCSRCLEDWDLLCFLNDALSLPLVQSNFDKSSWSRLRFGGFFCFVKSPVLGHYSARAEQ